jgi:hypothetical protein
MEIQVEDNFALNQDDTIELGAVPGTGAELLDGCYDCFLPKTRRRHFYLRFQK